MSNNSFDDMINGLDNFIYPDEAIKHDIQQEKEMNAVYDMIRESTLQYPSAEVIIWFGQYRANGEDVIEACNHALEEWIK